MESGRWIDGRYQLHRPLPDGEMYDPDVAGDGVEAPPMAARALEVGDPADRPGSSEPASTGDGSAPGTGEAPGAGEAEPTDGDDAADPAEAVADSDGPPATGFRDRVVRRVAVVLLPLALVLAVGALNALVRDGRIVPIGPIDTLSASMLGAGAVFYPPPPFADFQPRDLVGEPAEQVAADLEAVGLTVESEPDVRSDVPPGRVTSVSKEGSRVVVRFSASPSRAGVTGRAPTGPSTTAAGRAPVQTAPPQTAPPPPPSSEPPPPPPPSSEPPPPPPPSSEPPPPPPPSSEPPPPPPPSSEPPPPPPPSSEPPPPPPP